MSKPIVLILNGPNLNMVGIRNPKAFGGAKFADIERVMRGKAEAMGFTLEFRQSNHEGVMVDWIHEAHERVAGVIINPSALTHTSIAIADALSILSCPVIELHFGNVHRDPAKANRHRSMVRAVATGVIAGFGPGGYLMALDAVAMEIEPVNFRQS
ncbi:type II 3-dehydroquinate dehydratase [Sinorhizobium meliloti]|uniref:type II 3-dehydroquinate dehydratase n=1 Tax=Rhizobium meliloti TaxID=382 RepID=UPI000FDB593C|nr:type II 3-dehydroquinate dehydratase [Sinorhizobium meliloti]RVI81809.1 3-dehydroquinate dehydratase [Sinorhizobium meliloti]